MGVRTGCFRTGDGRLVMEGRSERRGAGAAAAGVGGVLFNGVRDIKFVQDAVSTPVMLMQRNGAWAYAVGIYAYDVQEMGTYTRNAWELASAGGRLLRADDNFLYPFDLIGDEPPLLKVRVPCGYSNFDYWLGEAVFNAGSHPAGSDFSYSHGGVEGNERAHWFQSDYAGDTEPDGQWWSGDVRWLMDVKALSQIKFTLSSDGVISQAGAECKVFTAAPLNTNEYAGFVGGPAENPIFLDIPFYRFSVSVNLATLACSGSWVRVTAEIV